MKWLEKGADINVVLKGIGALHLSAGNFTCFLVYFVSIQFYSEQYGFTYIYKK